MTIKEIVSGLSKEEIISYIETEEKYIWVESHVLDFSDDSTDVDEVEDLIEKRIKKEKIK